MLILTRSNNFEYTCTHTCNVVESEKKVEGVKSKNECFDKKRWGAGGCVYCGKYLRVNIDLHYYPF